MTDPITPEKLRELADADRLVGWIEREEMERRVATQAALRAAADEIERIHGLVAARKAIYQTKKEAADPFTNDDSNRYDRMSHTVEAFEHLEAEIALMPVKEG